MAAIVSLLVVLVFSMLVVRIATVALTLTGLSKEAARFQARSAFTGAGFTTVESEMVVQHPVRRRVVMLLMLLGNAGIVTAVSSLMLSFVTVNEAGAWHQSLLFRIPLLLLGLAALWIFATSRWVDRRLSALIKLALKRWTELEVRDYAGLLHLAKGYAVAEMIVEPQDWLADKRLMDAKLTSEGVLVLGLQRPDGAYLGAPRGQTVVRAGDTLILYGPDQILADLDQRTAGSEGNWAHHKAINRQLKLQAEERQLEAEEDDGEIRKTVNAGDAPQPVEK